MSTSNSSQTPPTGTPPGTSLGSGPGGPDELVDTDAGTGKRVVSSRASRAANARGLGTSSNAQRNHEIPKGFGGLIERIVANRVLMVLMTAVTVLAVLIYGTATLPLQSHVVLSLLAIAIGLVVTQTLPEYRLISVVLSLAISLRYIIWRGLETLNLDHGWANAVVSVLLYGAEIYTVFVLIGGYFQTSIFLDRRAVPLPKELDRLPTVDVFIPTYNESVEIVRRTAVAAMAMDYPKKRVYILDDGRRAHMRELAEEVGCGYLTRPDNKHAKSGNINHAMGQTDGELLAFFDADHSPVKSFLTLTVGFFLENDNLALAQTPHHFYNPDPFERNLHTAGKVPPEQNLFYDLVQVSNDFWNSAFFCGSCAVIRRAALQDVGGMAVETVTEDAHTALKMQSRGWDTCYLSIPQAAGLATESFAGYVGQRVRWARGMAQILRIDPPFLKRGLAWYQRLNYTFAASHFFFGLPRLVFLLAPISYLVFGLNPLNEDVRVVLIYAVPHLILSYINASAANGGHRHTFWPEVYETAMAPYAALVTTMALISPSQGTFNVTAKGEQTDKVSFNWRVTWMLQAMMLLCLAGMPFFVWRYVNFPLERSTLWVALFWNIYNIALLLAAVAAAIERPQRRVMHRIKTSLQLIAVEQTALPDTGVDDEGVDERSAENSYASVDGVDPVEVYEDLRDEVNRRLETSEASLASELRQAPSVLPPEMPVADGAWRAAGRTIDVSEEGARFLLPPGQSVPRHMLVTLLGGDGSRVTVHTEALGAWRQPEGVVVRARFRHVTDAQVHALIRMMFSDPNTWTRDRFTRDKPLNAVLQVFTSPFRALFYALGVMQTPAEPLEAPPDAVPVHRKVLQCYHCNSVLTRPEPKCPHCGEVLMLADDRTLEPSTNTFDRLSSLPSEPQSKYMAFLLPSLLVVGAVILTLGWSGIFDQPSSALTRDEALELSYHYSADDGADLADELVRAIEADKNVSGDWGSRVARLRFEYPRPEDPRPAVHVGPRPEGLAQLFFRLHDLESRYRRGDAPPGIAADVRNAREEFKKLM
jgi:cellulose synthase catalytic subunit (UDP-forming)